MRRREERDLRGKKWKEQGERKSGCDTDIQIHRVPIKTTCMPGVSHLRKHPVTKQGGFEDDKCNPKNLELDLGLRGRGVSEGKRRERKRKKERERWKGKVEGGQ